jgi:hypothetical protein
MTTRAEYLDDTTAGFALLAGALVCKEKLSPTDMIGILACVIVIVTANIS